MQRARAYHQDRSAGLVSQQGANDLPQWDPRNAKVGMGTAYLNQLQRPSAGVSPALQSGIQAAAAGGLANPAGTRAIPGSLGAIQSRQQQVMAAGGVGGAGEDFRGQQMAATQDATRRGLQGSIMQQRLARQGEALGQSEAGQQQALARMLQQTAAGQGGPSPAAIQAQMATDRAASQMAGMAAGARGGNAAAAMRQATLAGEGERRAATQEAAVLRAQEQLAARGQLGGVLQGMRGQAIDTFGARGQLAGQMRGQGLAEALGQGQLAGQGRDADLQRAMGAVQAQGMVRGQDIAQQGIGLQGRSLDDQERQAEFGRAIAGGQFGAGLGQMDNQMMLQAGGQVNDYLLGRRAGDIQREALPSDFERTMGAIAPFASMGGAFLGGIAPSGGGAPSYPTANSADYLARMQARR